MKIIRVAGSCLNQTPLDWKNNKLNIFNAIQDARHNNVAILCLPELAITGYGCEDTLFSDYILRSTLEVLKEIENICNDIIVSVGLPMVFENCLYNVVAIIHNNKILGFVPKQELCGDGIHYEPRWFKPWIEGHLTEINIDGIKYPFGDLIFEIEGVRIGFEICEDAWNGVRPAQRHYLRNVDIIMNPSASHFAFGKTKIRKGLVVETSRSYSCAYVYSNLLGNEAGRVVYDGEILIAQSGNLLARNRRFSFHDHQILWADIDVEVPRRGKKKLFSFQFAQIDRLIISPHSFTSAKILALETSGCAEEISKSEEFFRAEILGLFDYMRKSRSKGFTLSLSGGADSTVCAVLAAKSILMARKCMGDNMFFQKLSYLNLPKEITDEQLIQKLLICIYQSTENSSEYTHQSAKELANELGATFLDWSIQIPLDEYENMVEKAINRKLEWNTDDIALQNIQARARVPALWMIANIQGGLLLATSNRSEAAVGYATMDGDTAGGLAPLGGVDKATLLQWLKWAEDELMIKSLKFVNNLLPSAELRPLELSQTDEKDLMPYPILDKIEKCAIRDYKSPSEVFITLKNEGIPHDALKSYIKKFFQLWCRNQWKRERYAPSFHLDDENLDPRTWCRFPILNSGYHDELLKLDEI